MKNISHTLALCGLVVVASPVALRAQTTAPKAAPAITKSDAKTADLATKLAAAAPGKPDAVLNGLGGDLASSMKALTGSLGANKDLKGTLDSTVQSLLGGKDARAVAMLQKLTAAKLTPDQTKLAGDFKNVLSAYVTQKNFAGIKGTESDVAAIVSALRKGETATALPALRKFAQTATLSPAQKELLGGVVDSYAPGLKQAGDSLQKGLKGFNLGK